MFAHDWNIYGTYNGTDNGFTIGSDPITIEAGGLIAGAGEITGALTNSGAIIASGGLLAVTGSVAGAGTLTIAPGATLQLDGPVQAGSTIAFASGGTATLVEYDDTQFPGTIVGQQSGDAVLACFASGTRIATAADEIPVECLAVGDHVLTRLGSGSAAVVWIGHRQVHCRQHPRPAEIWPVRVRSGAFAPGVPRRDPGLSGDHAVFVDGVLGFRPHIDQRHHHRPTNRDEVSYWHVELPRHDVLLAEGLPCETYLDTGNRSSFANGGVCVQMHPALSQQGGEAIWEAAGCAPLRITGDEVERCLARLRRRAAGSGAPRGRRIAAGPATCDLASLLRPSWYLASYPDVAAARICAATHYASWGYAEGRLPCPEIDLIRALGLVDPSMLVFTMADVVAAGADPVEHFCTKGWQEQRRPNPHFYTGLYLDQHQVPTGMIFAALPAGRRSEGPAARPAFRSALVSAPLRARPHLLAPGA